MNLFQAERGRAEALKGDLQGNTASASMNSGVSCLAGCPAMPMTSRSRITI